MSSVSNSSRCFIPLKTRRDLWNDSASDFSSISNSSYPLSLSQQSSCCLICSILPSLSTANCCTKHLKSLTKNLSSTCKTHHRSTVFKSKEKSHRYEQKKKSLFLKAFNSTDTDQQSSSEQRSTRSNRLSSSSMNLDQNNNYVLRRTRTTSSSTSIVQKRQQSTSINEEQSDTNYSYCPRILLKRIIHVKDEDEQVTLSPNQIVLNMSQATEQMIAQDDLRPRILLQRISFEE